MRDSIKHRWRHRLHRSMQHPNPHRMQTTPGVSELRRGRRALSLLAVTIVAALSGLAPLRADDDASPSAPSKSVADLHSVFEEKVGEVLLRQYEVPSLARFSYLLASGKEALVIDPLDEAHVYVQDAEELGLSIRYVALTRTHADFVSGHAALAAATGAPILASSAARLSCEHVAVDDGHEVPLGAATLEFLATPGATADGLTILLHTPATSLDPLYAFTGDVLQVGSVGTPERLPGEPLPARLAGQAFDSLMRLGLLPDDTRILPGVDADPPRPDTPRPRTWSTLGTEKKTNPWLALESRARFATRLLGRLRPARPWRAHVARVNREGRSTTEVPDAAVPALLPDRVAGAVARGAWIVDLRLPGDYAAHHLHGALNIPLQGRFEIWFGNVVPRDTPVFVVGTDAQAREAVLRLERVDGTRPWGRIDAEAEAWRAAGLRVAGSALLAPTDLARRRGAWIEPPLVDVRGRRPFHARHLEDSLCVPLGDLRLLEGLFAKDEALLFVCKTGYRSSIAVGLAERLGFEKTGNLAGGITAWVAAGLDVVPPRAAQGSSVGEDGAPNR